MSFARNLTTALAVIFLFLSGTGQAGSPFQLGTRPASDWETVLESEERLTGLKIKEVVAALKLVPGILVADIGAGTGVFTLPLARAVGSTGKVLAGDIDQELLDLIEQKARKAGLGNVQTVLGEFADPRLGSGGVDIAFMHDVLHHIAGREAYLKKLASYVRDSGRIVVIDYDTASNPEAPHQDQPEMQINLEQVKQWMNKAGFQLTQEHHLFDTKFFVEFARPR